MGSYNHDRELRQMRAAYVAAVRRLNAALLAFDNSGMPMDPGPYGQEPYPWTRRHVEIFEEVTAAFIAVRDARKTWDGHRREWRPTH